MVMIMKILGSDYDGTLNHKGISEEKKASIETWRKKGNVFALVTGRGAEDILKIYTEQQFPCDYIVCDNGAVIMKTDGEIISRVKCKKELIKPLVKLLFESDCLWGDLHSDLKVNILPEEKDCKNHDDYTLENMPEFDYFTQISTALPDFEKAKEVTEKIRDVFGNELNPLQNGTCIDIVRADMNKAKGIYLLMDFVGAEYEDVITVGDNINDIDMLKEFRSYAMENGVEEVKMIADNITSGIEELIEKELEK